MEIDINTLFSSLLSGAGIWFGIRQDLKFINRDIGFVKSDIGSLNMRITALESK